jgi:hypothetical protein
MDRRTTLRLFKCKMTIDGLEQEQEHRLRLYIHRSKRMQSEYNCDVVWSKKRESTYSVVELARL